MEQNETEREPDLCCNYQMNPFSIHFISLTSRLHARARHVISPWQQVFLNVNDIAKLRTKNIGTSKNNRTKLIDCLFTQTGPLNEKHLK